MGREFVVDCSTLQYQVSVGTLLAGVFIGDFVCGGIPWCCDATRQELTRHKYKCYNLPNSNKSIPFIWVFMVLWMYNFDTGFPVYTVHYRKGIVYTASWFTEILILNFSLPNDISDVQQPCNILFLVLREPKNVLFPPQIYEDMAVIGFPYSGLKDKLLCAV